jgi:chaperonin GroES
MAQSTQSHSGKTCCQSKSCPSLRPLGNRVLLRRLDAKETLKGGIILPDSAKKKQEQAEVVAIGTGSKDKNGNLIPIHVKVGDIVLIEKYSGQDVTLNDEEFVIAGADDLIAIIEN